jgi:RNA polymerase sigma factor (sigma-70 family)
MAAHAIRAPLVRLRVGSLDDARLAELAATGDERAFEVLYDRHHRPLLGFCRHMLGSQDEGEDALQQTFLRAHRALLAQGAPDDLRPWLFAIARNRCLTMLAARKAAAVPVEEVEPATDGLSDRVERNSELRDLLRDIARLPDEQRSALVLAEIGDLSHAEIAQVIEVPTGKVKALVHQARTRLIADREARETPCEDVREVLATATGGELRRGPLRRHLALCDGCSAYKEAVTKQRASLALVLPVLPSAGLKDTILGALGGGGGGAAAAAGGAAAGGAAASGAGAGAALTGGGAGSGLAAKLAIGAALATGAGGGAVVVEQAVHSPERPGSAAVASGKGAAMAPKAKIALPAGAGAAGAGSLLVDNPDPLRGSETGRANRESSAERRAERARRREREARERAAAKQRRIDDRRKAADDRAAAKDRRTAGREQDALDRAAAKDQRTTERDQRKQSRPANGPNERSTTTGPAAKPAPTIREPNPNAGSGANSGTERVKASPTPTAPSPALAPATGKSGQGKGRAIVEEVSP